MREFFVFHRMVRMTWRAVLTSGYFEPRNFPSFQIVRNIYKKRGGRGYVQGFFMMINEGQGFVVWEEVQGP